MSLCISYEGKQYIFSNMDNEESRMFYERCVFKVKNMNVFSDKDELEAMSHLWVQKKYLHVRYEDAIEDQLQRTSPIYAVTT